MYCSQPNTSSYSWLHLAPLVWPLLILTFSVISIGTVNFLGFPSDFMWKANRKSVKSSSVLWFQHFHIVFYTVHTQLRNNKIKTSNIKYNVEYTVESIMEYSQTYYNYWDNSGDLDTNRTSSVGELLYNIYFVPHN